MAITKGSPAAAVNLAGNLGAKTNETIEAVAAKTKFENKCNFVFCTIFVCYRIQLVQGESEQFLLLPPNNSNIKTLDSETTLDDMSVKDIKTNTTNETVIPYSRLYSWPNYSNGNHLAETFYNKATEHINDFPFKENCLICLCRQVYRSKKKTKYGNKCVYIYVNRLILESEYSSFKGEVRTFLDQIDCPKEQESEHIETVDKLTIENISKNLSNVRMHILKERGRVDHIQKPNLP